MKSVIIVGAGGFGLEVAAYAVDAGFIVKGFLDDTKPSDTAHADFTVLGSMASAIDMEAAYVIAVGNPQNRKVLAEKLAAKGARFISIIHPQSYVGPQAHIGVGAIVAPFAFVGPQAHIGAHCVLNTYACAGHECRINDYSVLSPYAALYGAAVLGSGVFMGSNAIITAQQSVGDNAKIAAGAIVYSNIPADVLAMGNPASFRKPA
jgi:sugar O-acyltransferase (sialic acid O-acetyltransferase NeuD family)